MDTLWRLAWALPLVLVTGVAAMLMLKRFMTPAHAADHAGRRMSLVDSLSLSDETRVHLIEVERCTYVVVESTRHALLQPMQAIHVARVGGFASLFAGRRGK